MNMEIVIFATHSEQMVFKVCHVLQLMLSEDLVDLLLDDSIAK